MVCMSSSLAHITPDAAEIFKKILSFQGKKKTQTNQQKKEKENQKVVLVKQSY